MTAAEEDATLMVEPDLIVVVDKELVMSFADVAAGAWPVT